MWESSVKSHRAPTGASLESRAPPHDETGQRRESNVGKDAATVAGRSLKLDTKKNVEFTKFHASEGG